MMDRRVSEKAALKEAAATLYLMALAAARPLLLRSLASCACSKTQNRFEPKKMCAISGFFHFINLVRGVQPLGLLPE